MPVICSVEPPCDYFDTVNITNAPKFDNGSYLYDGVLLKPNEVANYTYEMKYINVQIPAPKHLRGCVCLKRPCIFFCCPSKQKFNKNTESCEPYSTIDFEPIAQIDFGNNTEPRNVTDVFTVQVMSISKDVDVYPIFPFTIRKNDSTLKIAGMKDFEKYRYCLLGLGKKNQLTLAAKAEPRERDEILNEIQRWSEVGSVPFMLLTVFIYMYLKELRTGHGKSLACYLVTLSIGTLALNEKNTITEKTNEVQCKFRGYLAYYGFMCAFFWLNVISIDLWYNFRRCTERKHSHKSFMIVKSIYAFGLPTIMLILTVLSQELNWIHDEYKPGISTEHGCWLNTRNYVGALIYFFGPMLILIATNIIMFAITAYAIHSAQREFKKMTSKDSYARHMRKEKDRFGLFLRLFLLMGVAWIFNLSFFMTQQNQLAYLLLAPIIIMNALHGVLVFILFVLKKDVRALIMIKIFKRPRTGYMLTDITLASGTSQALQEKPKAINSMSANTDDDTA